MCAVKPNHASIQYIADNKMSKLKLFNQNDKIVLYIQKSISLKDH